MKLAVLNSLVLICVTLVIKAPLTWGFSISRTNTYIEKAKSLQLWTDPKWIKLGHYEKGLFGINSSFRGQLFLNPEGHNSPEKELLTTIEALFSDAKELSEKLYRHPQCQFLARRKWLINKLSIVNEDVLSCPERVQWKKQLGATRVSVIFASADLSNPASSFGHTFIKLINPENAKNKDLIDYGVNYAADANPNDGIFYALRGLFGGYHGVFTMLPYHQKIREYINLEGRDITEYTLNFTPEEVEELIDHLVELEKSSAPYYFASDNCSYKILYVLDVIRPELELSEKLPAWVIPVDTIKAITRKNNLVSERRFKKSLNTEYLEGFAKLNRLQKKALDQAVKNLKLANDYELSAKEKAEVYETGMKYFAVVNYRTGENTEEKKYQLSSARALLGPHTPPPSVVNPYFADGGHDSSAFYFGAGQLSDQLNNLNYTLVKFRTAFHDLEQSDIGMVPMSLNNAGVIDIRYFAETKNLSLYRFTVINLVNTVPITQLDNNISWRARIEVLDSFRPDIEYSVGASFDLGILRQSRISYFLTGRYLKEIGRHSGQIGPNILFITKPTKKLGISFDFSYLAQNNTTPLLRTQSKLNYEIKQNFDLQLMASEQTNNQKDYQLSLVKNFIF